MVVISNSAHVTVRVRPLSTIQQTGLSNQTQRAETAGCGDWVERCGGTFDDVVVKGLSLCERVGLCCTDCGGMACSPRQTSDQEQEPYLQLYLCDQHQGVR